MKKVANIKSIRKCAFCKYWYDPTNSAISPQTPKINLWNYEDNCKSKCLKSNLEMRSGAVCEKYECKLEPM